MDNNQRKYWPTLSELLDRLTITQIKQVKIPEYRQEYTNEINDLLNDINLELKENGINISAEFLRAIIIIAQYNLHIWQNEANYRKGIKEGNDLGLTHGLNSIRNQYKNKIQDFLTKNARKDYKLDNVEAYPQWIPSE